MFTVRHQNMFCPCVRFLGVGFKGIVMQHSSLIDKLCVEGQRNLSTILMMVINFTADILNHQKAEIWEHKKKYFSAFVKIRKK